ncbi:hypothetical protein KJK34_10560 [Flavobacterium sp. D11R37]|uniref:hypothetical protein n=1 Tax=Flavobacterium coralii TaxID=2838017 RepID=UPI001CA77CD5|nr:hypothetical protein [Flavobacterium coralii]MBY8963194.1 hypothetical protein [Flavobacterium coralii]
MDKNWFQTFIVLKIYNTTKKKYRKLFTPLKGKEYTYELEYAGGQMLQIQKKLWERNDFRYPRWKPVLLGLVFLGHPTPLRFPLQSSREDFHYNH